MSLLFVIYLVWCTCKLRPSVSLKQYIKNFSEGKHFFCDIRFNYSLSLFLSITKSFRPFWDGRKLTQKCRYRWFCAVKSDKSQKANVAVFAQEPVDKSLYNIIDLCYSHIYLQKWFSNKLSRYHIHEYSPNKYGVLLVVRCLKF